MWQIVSVAGGEGSLGIRLLEADIPCIRSDRVARVDEELLDCGVDRGQKCLILWPRRAAQWQMPIRGNIDIDHAPQNVDLALLSQPQLLFACSRKGILDGYLTLASSIRIFSDLYRALPEMWVDHDGLRQRLHLSKECSDSEGILADCETLSEGKIDDEGFDAMSTSGTRDTQSSIAKAEQNGGHEESSTKECYHSVPSPFPQRYG
ncbi:hypothetical protein HRG_012302 [Hirsutella rhossiliensis]